MKSVKKKAKQSAHDNYIGNTPDPQSSIKRIINQWNSRYNSISPSSKFNLFNNFFTSFAEQIINNLPPPPKDYMDFFRPVKKLTPLTLEI